jgi:hypothetical protein
VQHIGVAVDRPAEIDRPAVAVVHPAFEALIAIGVD